MRLPDNYKDRLINELRHRGVNSQCELCKKNNWSILEQAVSILVADPSGAFRIPPPQVPSAALICNNCGNIRLISLGVLNLLDNQEGGGNV